MSPLARYDPKRPYRWNRDHAPIDLPAVDVPPCSGRWTYCGRPVGSPLGIAAGPLLNARWVLFYAALGFDVLTYKTVRSVERESYPLPNLVPVDDTDLLGAGDGLLARDAISKSWAISFGMPSMTPAEWRADVELARSRLPAGKLLVVSVVASPEPEWSLDDVASDYARCARWAVESGADAVETNFSCPNVCSFDGQLYQQPEKAAVVASRLRDAVGARPLVVKVGFVPSGEFTGRLVSALAPHVDGLSMTNCISATVRSDDGRPLFDGQPRGIGGEAIRAASVEQVRRFAREFESRRLGTRLVGVGGIATGDHVRAYLDAGAESVALATAAMLDPTVALRIRPAL